MFSVNFILYEYVVEINKTRESDFGDKFKFHSSMGLLGDFFKMDRKALEHNLFKNISK